MNHEYHESKELDADTTLRISHELMNGIVDYYATF